jgi:superfamily I DNA/RNA helicase
VAFYTEFPRPKAGERCAVLSRTNLSLFEKALRLRSKGIPFSLEGNIGAILGRILDVYWLSEEEHGRIRDPFIQSFASLYALETYAGDLDDFQLAGLAKVVREYADVLPDAVYDMMQISKNTTENRNAPGIILSTVHGAKGQEYDRVYIDPDVSASLSRPEGLKTPSLGDEANIAYVGFTRAIRELHLPQDFKRILNSKWQAAMERFERSRISKTSMPPLTLRKRAVRPGLAETGSGEFTTEAQRPKPPRKRPFKVGDRVKTGHGTGVVVVVDGEKYLVDLDGGAAQLWEKAWAMSKA